MRAHQSSSPSPIIEGIEQIAKGTRRIMHEMTIMNGRVASLEKANEILSKRWRQKKKYVRKGGSLNIQESQDILTQRDQIQIEERVGRGRKPREERAT